MQRTSTTLPDDAGLPHGYTTQERVLDCDTQTEGPVGTTINYCRTEYLEEGRSLHQGGTEIPSTHSRQGYQQSFRKRGTAQISTT